MAMCLAGLVAVTSADRGENADAGGAASETTAFERDDHGGVVVEVRVNGKGPFRMLLDTGSTHSAIAGAVVRSMGLPLVARTVLSTASGASEQVVARMDRLQLGPAVAEGVQPTVIEALDLDGPRPFDGVIGQDVLAPLHYTIDYARGRLAWHHLPDALGFESPARGFALTLVNGRFVVDLPQRDSVLRLVPDSGAAGLVLFEDRIVAERLVQGRTVARDLATLNGTVRVRQTQLPELRIGRASWFDVPAVLVPRHGAGDSGADGLLPLRSFRRVTFDGPRRRLHLGD